MSSSEVADIGGRVPFAGMIREIAVAAAKATECAMVAIYAGFESNLVLVDAVGVPKALMTALNEMTWLPDQQEHANLLHVRLESPAYNEALHPALIHGRQNIWALRR